MDRLKFRVWDNKEKTYNISSYGRCALTEDGELFWIELDCECAKLNTEDYIVEQCTGLRDNNGRLIFEGDVISVNGEKWRVIWDDEDCSFFFSNLKEVYHQPIFPDFYMGTEDFKVIGNIHENEGLLK